MKTVTIKNDEEGDIQEKLWFRLTKTELQLWRRTNISNLSSKISIDKGDLFSFFTALQELFPADTKKERNLRWISGISYIIGLLVGYAICYLTI